MSLIVDWIAMDCRDAGKLAEFWSAALDYEIVADDDDDEVLLVARDGSKRRLLLLTVPEEKQIKNRLHLDLRPSDQGREVERLLGLGATEADIGQGDVSWVVMADPEGNEFCVLRALDDDERAQDLPYGD